MIKVALLAAKRQFPPCKVGSTNRKNYVERVSKEIESKQKKRLEILQKWIEADQELETANAKQFQAKQEMALLEDGFQSHMSGPICDQVAQHTVLSVFKSVLSMQSMGCHGVSEQLMAAGATEEDVRKISMDCDP